MIPLFKVRMPRAAIESAAMTLGCGYIGQGPRVNEFEERFGKWIGNPLLLTVNSGTSALELALRTAGVGPGDTVISTPMTCLATNAAIRATGADIIWADVDPVSGCMHGADLLRKIRANTKAIVVVHWGGNPVNLDVVQGIANAAGLRIIEDAAHAIGSWFRNKRIGNHSDFICFSFQAIKHLTTVDGGAIAFAHEDEYARAKLLRWYGLPREVGASGSHWLVDVPEVGYKFHMNDVAAAIGIAQMADLESVIETHRENAAYYKAHLPEFASATECPYAQSSYWLYTLHVHNRDQFSQSMRTAGIEVSQVHARNDLYSAFASYRVSLEGVDAFYKTMICIPVGWWVTCEDREYIVSQIKRFGIASSNGR